jgi:hypothetical protein
LIVVLMMSAGAAWGQKYPERRHIRAGNREYAAGQWAAGEVEYRRALERDSSSYEARFNLANALYKQEQFGESARIFTALAADSTRADRRAAACYNAGNALFGERKLEEALEAYKNSMRADPADQDAKFNYAYVKKMLDKQQGGGGGGGGENEQEQEQQQQNEQQQQQQQGDGQEQQQQEQQEQQGGLSRGDAEQMLEAIQAQENRTQEKVDEKERAVAVGRSRKNW